MPVATLSDLQPKSSLLPSFTDSSGNVYSQAGNATWGLNVGLFAMLLVVVNVIHLPAFVLLVLNGAFLTLNLNAMRRVGRDSTPTWVFIIMAFQAAVVLQYCVAVGRDISHWLT